MVGAADHGGCSRPVLFQCYLSYILYHHFSAYGSGKKKSKPQRKKRRIEYNSDASTEQEESSAEEYAPADEGEQQTDVWKSSFLFKK